MADESTILKDLQGVGSLFGKEMKAAGSAGIAMAGELLNANQSLSAYTSALDGNSKILGSFGKVINGLTKFAEESLQEYQTLSGIGATFGKEMSNIKISAAEMGMSVKDMTDMIMKNSDSLRTFGGTTDLAISRFTRFSKAVLDSDAGTELRRLGYTASDINETLLTYNELAQQDGLNRNRSTAEQVASARDFALELDGLAKLTGKQRKELADEMKSRRREGDVQAFLMGQSAETQEQFMMATQKIKDTMGPQFEALFQDLMIRGAPITEETRNAFIALGGSADEFEATVSSFKQGMNTGEFDNFNDTLTGAQGAFLDNLKTDEARTMAMQSGLSGVADAMANAYSSSYDFANAVDASTESQENAQQTIQRLQQQISEEQLVQMQTSGGMMDKTIQMQESLREFTVAATTEVLPRLESMAVKGIDMFLEKLPPADQIAAQLGEGVSGLLDRIDQRTSQPYNIDLNNTPTAGDNQVTGAIAEQAASMGASLENSVETSAALATSIAENEQEIANAQQEIASAQANLGDLTNQGFNDLDPPMRAAQERLVEAESNLATAVAQSEELQLTAANERANDLATAIAESEQNVNTADEERAATLAKAVEDAQVNLEAAISEGDDSILSAVNKLNRSLPLANRSKIPTNRLGSTTMPRMAKGGTLDPNEVALVGESGAEFVRGPGEVTSARESMGVMQNLIKGIKTLEESVQTQTTNTENSISSSNNNNNSNLEPKFDVMIGLLSQLVSVESNAASTAQRTYKATKGLQGNMLKGLGV